MSKIRLVELVGKNFEPIIEIYGLKKYLNTQDELKIDYFSFNPPSEFLYDSKKIIAEKFYLSRPYNELIKKSFEFLNFKYNQFKNLEEFEEKDKIIQSLMLKYSSEKEGSFLFDQINFYKELKKLPFFSELFIEYHSLRKNFLMSEISLKYNTTVKEYVDLYKKEFLGKEFDFEKFNKFLFEKYNLFIPKQL